MPKIDTLASDWARRYSSGTATSITHNNQYPYDRPREKAAFEGTSSSSAHTRLGHNHPKSQSGLMQTINTVVEQLKHMKHARHLWDVAVKRNGMTTSLALLGGVLLADTYLYPDGKLRQRKAVLQTNLAAAPPAANRNSSSNAGGSSSSISSRSTVGRHAPAHA